MSNKYYENVLRWKERIFPQYEVRRNKKQKSDFIEMLKSHYGDSLTVEEEKMYFSKNIVIGDVENADVVFCAHYDTCAALPFPNFITPKNILVYLLYQILITIVILALPFALTFAAAYFTESFILTELTLFLSMIGVLLLMFAGPANKHTANDNTSGVVTVLSLVDTLGAYNNCKAAFVLFDNEEAGLLGSAAFAKRHKKIHKSTIVVNFDCVSDGDYIFMAFSKDALKNDAIKKLQSSVPTILAEYGKTPLIETPKSAFYPSDQVNFKLGTAVASLNKKKIIGYYADKIHTKADTVFDENNIAALVHIYSKWCLENPENQP